MYIVSAGKNMSKIYNQNIRFVFDQTDNYEVSFFRLFDFWLQLLWLKI